MLEKLNEVAGKISKALSPEDLFGEFKGHAKASQHDRVRTMFREYVAIVHPDKYATDAVALRVAEAAFVRLAELNQIATAKIDAGSYGDRAVVPPPPKRAQEAIVVEVRKRRFTVGDLLCQGDICDLYHCIVSNGKADMPGIFKIAQHASDNDLVENEGKVLAQLYPSGTKEEKFYRYLLQPIDSFILRGKSSNRRVNVLPTIIDYHSFAEVHVAYPKGVDFRDMVWMFKRTLSVLGFIHNKGFIHGAVLPTHIMVHPVHHGAKLIDWSYAIPRTIVTHIKAISAEYRPFYPREVFEKSLALPATDIYMAAKCAVQLLGGNIETNVVPDSVPKPIQAFLNGCLLPAVTRRPDDAWKLHDEFEELLRNLVGKPKYRPFFMPLRH